MTSKINYYKKYMKYKVKYLDNINKLIQDQFGGSNDIKQIACGDAHTLILKNDGTIYATGANENGQLGLENNDDKYIFEEVKTINNVIQIACGTNHTLILKNDGTIYVTGYNGYGQLGLGNDDNINVFEEVKNINNVKQIACGSFYTLILKENGQIYATGQNYQGQLGLGNNDDKYIFEEVNTINNVIQIACGTTHTLILKNDGTIYATGNNMYGQLGLGNNGNKNVFEEVKSINNVKQIECGMMYTLICTTSGIVYATGDNNSGQLGLGNNVRKNVFEEVKNINNVKQIACGAMHTLILKNDGTIYTTGDNNRGQLGSNIHISNNVFNIVVYIDIVKQITCGRHYTALFTYDGKIFTTGDNNRGQLGLINRTDLDDRISKFEQVEILSEQQFREHQLREQHLPGEQIGVNQRYEHGYKLDVIRGKEMEYIFQFVSDEANLQRLLNITFNGEMGMDYGGLSKEFFNAVGKQLVIDKMFVTPIEKRFGSECPKQIYMLNKDITMEYALTVGRIIGVAINNEMPLSINLTRWLIDRLQNKPEQTTLEELLTLSQRDNNKDIIEEMYNKVNDAAFVDVIEYLTLKDVRKLFISLPDSLLMDVFDVSFNKELDKVVSISLLKENFDKEKYLRLVILYVYRLVDEVDENDDSMKNVDWAPMKVVDWSPIISKLREGIISVIGEEKLNTMDLYNAINGIKYTADDILNYVDKDESGISYSSQTEIIKEKWDLFSKVVKELSHEDLQKFVKFWTGSETLESKNLDETLSLGHTDRLKLYMINNENDKLMMAHTCFNQLDLYYNDNMTEDKMRNSINIAIENNSSFDLSGGCKICKRLKRRVKKN
jgi:alpha-tubulin suppressor-like RCC1 family protein